MGSVRVSRRTDERRYGIPHQPCDDCEGKLLAVKPLAALGLSAMRWWTKKPRTCRRGHVWNKVRNWAEGVALQAEGYRFLRTSVCCGARRAHSFGGLPGQLSGRRDFLYRAVGNVIDVSRHDHMTRHRRCDPQLLDVLAQARLVIADRKWGNVHAAMSF